MSRPSFATIAATAVSAALLTACGTGLEAQTYKEVGRQDGGSVTSGTLAVRNLYVMAPVSGSTIKADEPAVISGYFVNTGDSKDSLIGATSDVATTVALQQAGAVAQTIDVPAHGSSTSDWSIVLTGLSKPLNAGEYLPLTLTFAQAGRITLQVPIRAGDQGLDGREAEQDPYHSAE